MKKYLAFDVGGTSVKYAVVNEEGYIRKNVSRNRKCSS